MLKPLPALTKRQTYDLFIAKSNIMIGYSSFGLLISRVKSVEYEMKKDECPICKDSEFDIYEQDGIIFTPSCGHNVCAPCLAKLYGGWQSGWR